MRKPDDDLVIFLQHFVEVRGAGSIAQRKKKKLVPAVAHEKRSEGLGGELPRVDVRVLQRLHQRRNRQVSRQVRRQRASVGKISAKCCLFSAVSAPIFARNYAFCSIFQNLPAFQVHLFEIWQNLNFTNFETFAKFLLNFHKNC